MRPPLLSRLRLPFEAHIGPFWFGRVPLHKMPSGEYQGYRVIGIKMRHKRSLGQRLDRALHCLLPKLSPRYLYDQERLADLERYERALEEIIEVENTRLVCRLHGGDFGEDDRTCNCLVSLDGKKKAQAIARQALGIEEAGDE